jgi:hypothetical protein
MSNVEITIKLEEKERLMLLKLVNNKERNSNGYAGLITLYSLQSKLKKNKSKNY